MDTETGECPIWWWRDGNLGIHRFHVLKSPLILLGIMELEINRIAAVYSQSYYKCFVYIEAAPQPPTGVYDWEEDKRERYMNTCGYVDEEYGLYKNKYPVPLIGVAPLPLVHFLLMIPYYRGPCQYN